MTSSAVCACGRQMVDLVDKGGGQEHSPTRLIFWSQIPITTHHPHMVGLLLPQAPQADPTGGDRTPPGEMDRALRAASRADRFAARMASWSSRRDGSSRGTGVGLWQWATGEKWTPGAAVGAGGTERAGGSGVRWAATRSGRGRGRAQVGARGKGPGCSFGGPGSPPSWAMPLRLIHTGDDGVGGGARIGLGFCLQSADVLTRGIVQGGSCTHQRVSSGSWRGPAEAD